MMSDSNGTKTEGKPTVVISESPCVMCEEEKSGDTVFLSMKSFKGVVCTEHLIDQLKKWQKQKEKTGGKPA